MKNRKKVKSKILKISIGIGLFLFILFFQAEDSKVFAYTCSGSTPYCSAPEGGIVEGVYHWKYVSPCPHSVPPYHYGCSVCTTAKSSYPCSGNDTNCSGGVTTYTDSSCNTQLGFQGCCTSTGSCTSGCTPTCPSGTSGTNQGAGYITEKCKDDCGDWHTKKCYCEPCNLASCPSQYATSNKGFGYIKYDDCTNKCGVSRVRKCYCKEACPLTCPQYSSSTPQGTGNFTIDCYNDCKDHNVKTCYCPAANCSDYTDESDIDWYDECPSDNPDDCRDEKLEVPIPNRPDDTCDSSQTKTCYTKNKEPEPDPVPPEITTVDIVPVSEIADVQAQSTNLLTKLVSEIKAEESGWDEILGYTSNKHSGINTENPPSTNPPGLNNPVGLKASYTDTDGQQDIVALYIWWNPSTTKTFPTPIKIAGNRPPRTNSTQNWGFLIAREYSQTWEQAQIYVPYMLGETKTWKSLGNIEGTHWIRGPEEDDNDMVKINDITVSNSTEDPEKVDLQLILTFYKTRTRKYNIWSQVNDYVGFTALLKGGEIKEPNEWEDSGEDWIIDLERPLIDNIAASDNAVGEVTLTFTATDGDNGEFAYLRLDACKSGIDEPSDLSSEYVDNYNLQTCDSFSGENIDDVTNLNSLLGDQGDVRSLNTNSLSRDVDIDLGGNKEGAVTFHLTVLDKAGNVKQDTSIYKLEQWATAKDGFVFGLNGVTSSTREVDVSKWSGHPVLEDFRDSYVTDIDLTNQVLLGAKSLSSIFLRDLVYTDSNLSFSAANYPGLFLGLPYQELKMAYRNKAGANIDLVSVGSTLTGGLPADCTTEYCILEGSEDLLIDEFVCDGKALIAIDGNVTIQPNLTNDTDQDACIILASGDIEIGYGDRVTVGDTPGYDIVEAFLIAGGKIDIPSQTSYDPRNDDGLYVEGGLVSFTPPSGSENRSSVYNQREILFSNMGIYPVLVVDNNAKYGMLSKTIFGSQIDVFKTEVGFKPY